MGKPSRQHDARARNARGLCFLEPFNLQSQQPGKVAVYIEHPMAQNLYITGAEHGSGKSVIVLAMMDYFSGHTGKVGFFRPVTRSDFSTINSYTW